MKYRSDVDGLRALAVLPVVLFHAHIPGLAGGFIGVDIFFVISGYLICSLIAAALARNEFSIIRFYENRCRRILPALTAMFVVTSAVAAWVLLPPDMEGFCRSLVAATFFVSNIFFWRTSSYFDGGSDFKPLLHTWSLGVEEQFYIFMPLVLYVVARWLKSRYTIWLLVLTLPSFALSVWGLTNAPTATFYLLPMRFWELAIGALIALRPERSGPSSRAVREISALAGLLAILYGITMLSEESPFPGWNALFPCLGAAAIIDAGTRGGSLVSRLLSIRPLVFIGKISYSLYLWHWPLLALAKYQAMRQLTVTETSLIVLCSLLISILSWRYVEMQFRRESKLFDSRAIFAGSAAAMMVMTLAAVMGIYSQGLEFRYPDFKQQVISGNERYNEGTCFLDGDQTFSAWRGDDCFLSRGQGRTVLLWGDSYAAHYAPGIIDESSRLSADYLQYTASACPPVFGYYTAIRPHCREFNDNLPKILSKYGIKTIVMAGRWESLFKRGVTPGQVAETVERLNRMGVFVYVIGQSPVFNNDVQTLFVQAGNAESVAEAAAPLSFRRDINERLASVLPAGAFIDPLRALCRGEDCDFRRSGQYLMADSGHLSSFGSKLAVATYFPFVSK